MYLLSSYLTNSTINVTLVLLRHITVLLENKWWMRNTVLAFAVVLHFKLQSKYFQHFQQHISVRKERRISSQERQSM